MNLKEGKAAQKLAGSSASVTREGVLIFRQSGAQQTVFEFPFAPPISDVEVRPIINGDKALAQARQAIAAMAGS